MRVLDLRQEQVTLEELLNWAASDPVRILARNGQEFILEEADAFEKEIEVLGNSDKFMKFLEERSNEPSVISLDEFEKTLN